jgi:hypothetical protein
MYGHGQATAAWRRIQAEAIAYGRRLGGAADGRYRHRCRDRLGGVPVKGAFVYAYGEVTLILAGHPALVAAHRLGISADKFAAALLEDLAS